MLAVDWHNDRQVALKVLHPRRAVDWKSFDLFDREAAVLRGLDHPGIPRMYDIFRAPWEGSEAGFIAMEYVEGESLAEHIAAQRVLAPERVTELLVALLGVLEYLHTRVPPILHRDIKPANIIVRRDGAPALVDFGAVRNILLGADEDGSTIVGTYGYMPYEQLMGRATPASDLYALGATFLHLVAGRPPSHFLEDDGGHLVVPASLPGGSAFRDTIARMLRAAPSERFASAQEARHALLNPSKQDEARRRPLRTCRSLRPWPLARASPARDARQAVGRHACGGARTARNENDDRARNGSRIARRRPDHARIVICRLSWSCSGRDLDVGESAATSPSILLHARHAYNGGYRAHRSGKWHGSLCVRLRRRTTRNGHD
jgi:serine/threonine protein kinase